MINSLVTTRADYVSSFYLCEPVTMVMGSLTSQ